MPQKIPELHTQNGELGKRLASSESEKIIIANSFEKLDHKPQVIIEQRNQLQESEQQACCRARS
jgi:hypothetical protein